MKRPPVYLVCGLMVCWVTLAVAWIVGLSINCIFIDGCYGRFGFFDLVRLIDVKSVLVRGILLSLVFTLFAWAKLRCG